MMLVPLLLLAGCTGTPLGDQLSGSFSPGSGSGPPASSGPAAERVPAGGDTPGSSRGGNAGTPAAGTPAAGSRPLPGNSDGAGSAPGNGADPSGAGTTTRPRATGSPPPPRPPAANPAPYRVTIKLPAADPSAPAEALTRALRSAGLSFEVETIERVNPGTGSRNPAVTPAPAVR